MVFSDKKSLYIYTARRSERNVKCKKQVYLLMIEDGGKSYYTAIKNISRLLSKLKGKNKREYHFCMNCFNGFRTESARDKHYEYCSSNGHVKVKMPTEEGMLYADFESILKPFHVRCRDKMNAIKAGRKFKAPYMEKINTHQDRMYIAPLPMEMSLTP